MRISNVNTYLVSASWRNWLFLELETDEGLVGVGEGTLEWKEKTVEAAIQEWKQRYLLGSDPFRIEDLWLRMYRNEFWRGGALLMTVISAVEIACWDLLGKFLGQPIYNLLGGPVRDRVRAYANGWYVGERTPQNFARQARAVVSKGYQALKVDPFGAADRQMDRSEAKLALEILEAIRAEIGEDVEIMIECHGRFDPVTAVRMARELERVRPFWYEEPIGPENPDALKNVADRISIPVAAGERCYTRYGFREMIENQAASFLQPDVIHVGGILEMKKVAAMADTYYVPIAPHNPNGPVATAATLQVDFCVPNFCIQESFEEFDVPWRREIVRGGPRLEDGAYLLPTEPGLGTQLNHAAIEEHPYDPRSFFNMWEHAWQNKFR